MIFFNYSEDSKIRSQLPPQPVADEVTSIILIQTVAMNPNKKHIQTFWKLVSRSYKSVCSGVLLSFQEVHFQICKGFARHYWFPKCSVVQMGIYLKTNSQSGEGGGHGIKAEQISISQPSASHTESATNKMLTSLYRDQASQHLQNEYVVNRFLLNFLYSCDQSTSL